MFIYLGHRRISLSRYHHQPWDVSAPAEALSRMADFDDIPEALNARLICAESWYARDKIAEQTIGV